VNPAERDRAELREIERKLAEAQEQFGAIHLWIEEIKQQIQEADSEETRDELTNDLSNFRGEVDWLWEQIGEYEKALKPRKG
jgi:peptidoglycan hydrolase CwlO-like protein